MSLSDPAELFCVSVCVSLCVYVHTLTSLETEKIMAMHLLPSPPKTDLPSMEKQNYNELFSANAGQFTLNATSSAISFHVISSMENPPFQWHDGKSGKHPFVFTVCYFGFLCVFPSHFPTFWFIYYSPSNRP